MDIIKSKKIMKGVRLMLKISTKASLKISIALSVALLAAVAVGMVLMPSLVRMLIDIPDNIGFRSEISPGGRVFILVLAYIVLLTILLADILLLSLLLRVRRGKVFTPESVSLIRGVSWCVIFIGAYFFILGIYFQLAFIVSFVAVFVGLCLRVVKNVIEEAVNIKSENDLTV